MSNTCPACNSVLEQIEYQSRAADEAHTRIIACSKCPLNAARIKPDYVPPNSPVRFSRAPLRTQQKQDPLVLKKIGSAFKVSVRVHNFTKPENTVLEQLTALNFPILPLRDSETPFSQIPTLGFVYNGGPYTPLVCYETWKEQSVDMCTKVSSMNIYQGPTDNVGQRTNYGRWHMTHIEGEAYFIIQYGSDTTWWIERVYTGRVSETVIRSMVASVYMAGYTPTSLTVAVQPSRLLQLQNVSSRAWDQSVIPEAGYSFTSKPDGERAWVLIYEYISYVVRPSGQFRISKWWKNSNTLKMPGSCIVVDTEYVSTHGFILIDMLTDTTGECSPTPRDMTWVLAEFTALKSMCKHIPISVRQYFASFQLAQLYCADVPYSTDGVLAVKDGSVEALKLKEVRSIELLCDSEYFLVDSTGNQVMKLSAHISTWVGKIVEIRFTFDNLSVFEVHDIFVRPDKNTPNSSAAVSNILQSARHGRHPHDSERRRALTWCNTLRNQLVKLAVSVNPNKTIVIDIGTGTGQSLDNFIANSPVSLVLIEPDTSRCRMICKRAALQSYLTSPKQLLHSLRALKSRAVKYVVVNCTFQDLIADTEVTSLLFPEVKSILCTFSMQYALDGLHEVAVHTSIPVFGCTYLYDKSQNGVLVDTCGVSMVCISKETANVTWGRDKSYTEPVTYIRDYAGIGIIVPGSEVVELPDKSVSTGPYQICSQVYVLKSNRHF